MNRFALLESKTDSEECSVWNMVDGIESNANMVGVEVCVRTKKARTAAVGVVELMKTLKSKRKGPIDKGKSKQVKVSSVALGSSTSTSL